MNRRSSEAPSALVVIEVLHESHYAPVHNGYVKNERLREDADDWRRPVSVARGRHRRRRARLGAAHNEPTLAELGGERFERMRAEALEILDTDARIPYVRRRGDFLYNYWRDAAHPRGLWRRTTLESYRTDAPEWDVLIDLDALAAADDEKWVWAGAEVIEPDYSLALVELSRGGSDATVVREFDMATREFVVDGFAAAGGEDQHRLGGPRHRAGGDGLRPRLPDRLRLPARRQALATRPAAGRGPDGVSGRRDRRQRRRGIRPDARIRAPPRVAVGRLLQPRALRDPRRANSSGSTSPPTRASRSTGSGC